MQIETYVACNQNTFSEVISQFQQVLESAHCTSPNVLDWLSHLKWPSWEKGYAVDYPTLSLQSPAGTFPARPYILFPMSREEERWADWVELGVMFEARPLRESNLPFGPCKVDAGYFMWNVLEAFALTFLEHGVYFTDEFQGGKAGDVLMESAENFWLYPASDPAYPLFDAAIVPIKLVDRFQPIPEIFERVSLPGAVGVAAKDHFLVLPWKTSPYV